MIKIIITRLESENWLEEAKINGKANNNTLDLNNMNEAETRAELIDPKLKSCGWAGEEMLIDCAGKKFHIVDKQTGELIQ